MADAAVNLIKDPTTNFRDIPNILPNPGVDDTALLLCKQALIERLRAQDWSNTITEVQSGALTMFYQLALKYSQTVVDGKLLCALFNTKNLMVPVGEATLSLINYAQNNINYSADNPQFLIDFQRAISRWSNNLFKEENKLKIGDNKSNRRGHHGGAGRHHMLDDDDDFDPSKVSSMLPTAFDWWQKTCDRLRQERNSFQKELEWVIVSQLSAISLPGPKFALETIRYLGSFNERKTSDIINSAFSIVLNNCISMVHVDEALKALYPGLRIPAANSMSSWTKNIHIMLMERILSDIKLEELTTSNRELGELLKQSGDIWPFFIQWFISPILEVGSNPKSIVHGQWEILSKKFNIISEIFMIGSNKMKDESCVILDILETNKIRDSIMEKCWTSLQLKDIHQINKSLFAKVNNRKNELEKFTQIASKFYKDSKIENFILTLLTNWEYITIIELRVIFGELSNPSTSCRYNSFPSNFLNAWEWLYYLIDSQLFTLIWNEQDNSSSDDSIEKLINASISFKKEFENIMNLSTTFNRMKLIAPILNETNERKKFTEGANGFTIHSSSNNNTYIWNIQNRNKEQASKLKQIILKWLHLNDVHNRNTEIIRILNCLDVFIKTSGISSLDEVKNAANTIYTIFQKENYDEKQLLELERFVVFSSKIVPCLVRLEPRLFEGICNSLSLLEWLRELPDDINFKSSIEEAMGKSEMECPPDLWQDASNGKPGRVDEQKLSMLSTVRGYLHDLIFRKSDRFDHVNHLFNILKDLRETDENVLNGLQIANEYRVSLRELLDSTSASGAPDRLLQLLAPERKAKWICKTNHHESSSSSSSSSSNMQATEGSIWLTWIVTRANKSTEKKQNINEIMDFQSSIVLAKTDQREINVTQAVDNFIQQFGWIKLLNENLTLLLQSGHFDYQKFEIQFSFNEKPSVIRNKVKECKEILDSWIELVEKQRISNYYFNYFKMKHIWKLVSTIRCIDPLIIENNDLHDTNYLILCDLFRLCDPSLDEEELSNIITSFYSNWIKNEKLNHTSKNLQLNAIEALKLCGNCLQNSLFNLKVRTRKINLPEIENYPAGAYIYKGINILSVDNKNDVYDHILSSYARVGYLPERELVYICRPTTTWDDIYTFLLRWIRSHEYGRENKFYCLGLNIYHLKYNDVQHQ